MVATARGFLQMMKVKTGSEWIVSQLGGIDNLFLVSS